MFLSTYENKLDKKGRVSVPASFRSHLSNLGYNGVICYPSFNNASIEACSQDRIEKISTAIDSLNPFEEKRDFFATSILAESTNLQFDGEGRIPYPETTNGNYANHPSKYYKYTSSLEFNKLANIMNEYSSENIEENSGVSISTISWNNLKFCSWLEN